MPEEFRLAFRNRGMPLEAMRPDLTPTGLHYFLAHWDIPLADPASWRLTIGGCVRRPLSEQRGLPAARHWRHFEQVDDELIYRIAVEYQPRPGWRGPFDGLLVRHAVERALRERLTNLDRRFHERSSRARLSDTRG